MKLAVLIALVGTAELVIWYYASKRSRRPGPAQVDAPKRRKRRSGWVYFATVKQEPKAPVKIGWCRKSPSVERLPELQTLSPYPLTLLYVFYSDDARTAESAVHEHLGKHRRHGEWFDRDAAEAYIDHLKGEY